MEKRSGEETRRVKDDAGSWIAPVRLNECWRAGEDEAYQETGEVGNQDWVEGWKMQDLG